MINAAQVGVRKKVSFQFNFKAVQRKFRVTQVHWECIPGSRRSEVEFARTYQTYMGRFCLRGSYVFLSVPRQSVAGLRLTCSWPATNL